MQTDIGQKLTLLGLCAVIFYGVMLATGLASLEVMPQFLVSALVFVFSGRVVRMTGTLSREREDEDISQAEEPQPAASEEDWARLTVVFNWLAVIVIITLLALWVIKPQGVSLAAFVQDAFINYDIYDELLSP